LGETARNVWRDHGEGRERGLAIDAIMSTAKAANAEEPLEAIAVEEGPIEGQREIGEAELKAIVESLIFVAEEPINAKTIADVVDLDRETVESAIQALVREYESRPGGLQLREIAGGVEIPPHTAH